MTDFLKKLSEASPILVLSFAVMTGIIGVYASKAVADHNDDKNAHPELHEVIVNNSNNIKVMESLFELTQQQNKKAHSDQEKKIDRVIVLLDRVEAKIDKL